MAMKLIKKSLTTVNDNFDNMFDVYADLIFDSYIDYLHATYSLDDMLTMHENVLFWWGIRRVCHLSRYIRHKDESRL